MTSGTQPTIYQLKQGENWQTVAAHVIEEATVCLHVNGQELAAFMCTPLNLEALALGFLRAEGIIAGLEDVALVESDPRRLLPGRVADPRSDPARPGHPHLRVQRRRHL